MRAFSAETTTSPSFEEQQRIVRETRAQSFWQRGSPQVKADSLSGGGLFTWNSDHTQVIKVQSISSLNRNQNCQPQGIKVEPLSPLAGGGLFTWNKDRSQVIKLGTRPSLSGVHHDHQLRPFCKTNDEEFVCSVCEMFIIEEQGVTLKACNHNFCQPCLVDAIKNCRRIEVPCPMTAIRCDKKLCHEEILALVGPGGFAEIANKSLNEPEDHLNSSTVPHLLELENHDFVENRSAFNCAMCLTDIDPGDGIMLKNCLHEYCKGCLGRHIKASDEVEIQCPFVAEDGTRCEGVLQDRELRSLVDEEVYAAHLMKSLERAEAMIKDSFHCKTPDCPGWAEIGELVTNFFCPVCSKDNCVKCKVIHEDKSCEEYFYETNEGARKNRDEVLTEAQLLALINAKQAMKCPGCGVVIQKTTGCNHMTCSRCKREFQWQGLA